MAHKSKKKHVKHQHQHEVEQAAATKARKPRTRAQAAPRAKAADEQPGGFVRSIARAAAKKITARPRRVFSRVKAGVKSVLGRK